MSQQIYSEGKLAFTSRLHARQIQYQLKKAGFVYETDSQRIRPGAYGVMWRKEYRRGAYRATMRTAGNEAVFVAYGAHKKTSLYTNSIQVVNNEPWRRKMFEIVQAEQRHTNEIVQSILDFMNGLNVGYDFNVGWTKHGTPVRIETWTAFVHLLKDKHPGARPYQVRRAIKTRYKHPPENRKLSEFLKLPRPQGLPIGTI